MNSKTLLTIGFVAALAAALYFWNCTRTCCKAPDAGNTQTIQPMKLPLDSLIAMAAPAEIFMELGANQIGNNAYYVDRFYEKVPSTFIKMGDAAYEVASGTGNCCPRYIVCCPKPPTSDTTLTGSKPSGVDGKFTIAQTDDIVVSIVAPSDGCNANFILVSEDGKVLANAAQGGQIEFDPKTMTYYLALGSPFVKEFTGNANYILSLSKNGNTLFNYSYPIKI